MSGPLQCNLLGECTSVLPVDIEGSFLNHTTVHIIYYGRGLDPTDISLRIPTLSGAGLWILKRSSIFHTS